MRVNLKNNRVEKGNRRVKIRIKKVLKRYD